MYFFVFVKIGIFCKSIACLLSEAYTKPYSTSNQTTSALRLIMRSSNTGRKTSSVASVMWHVANILLFNFCEQKCVQHGQTTIPTDFNGLSLFIIEEKWPDYASGPKNAPNNDSFWVSRLSNVCVRVFCAPNETNLLVYIPAKIKMSFI